MKIKHQCPIGRLIAKIDNDFNISESDWIPRVAAWVTDALEQMNCLPKQKRCNIVPVHDRIACIPNYIDTSYITVYDSNGCELNEAGSSSSCCKGNKQSAYDNNPVISMFHDDGKGVNTSRVATIVTPTARNYVITKNNQIELNYDTDSIRVETLEVAKYYDDYYDCEVPYIYDNGLLLEALAWYCLFKYLSRGSKHPVFDLKSPNQAINPYIQWTNYKTKAATAVKIEINNTKDGGWNNFFYNSTFLPRG